MATTVHLVKTQGGVWIPATDSDKEEQQPLKVGTPYKVEIKEVRNYRFHKKGLSLLRFLFEHWEPEHDPEVTMYRGVAIEKDFDQFRKNLTVLAGFYTPVWNMRGEVRLIPESLSFSSMTEERFRKVYRALLAVGWRKILAQVGYKSPEQVEQTLNALMRFE